MQAYHRGIGYPEYVWFTSGGLTAEWWTEVPVANSSCPPWLVAKSINGSFGFLPHGYIVDEDEVFDTLSGEVYNYNNYYAVFINNFVEFAN